MEKRNKNFNPRQIAADLATATGTRVATRAIYPGLNQAGLYAGSLFNVSHLKNAIVEKDCVGLRNILFGGQKQLSREMFFNEYRFPGTNDFGHQLV